jgi:hypothetical protein
MQNVGADFIKDLTIYTSPGIQNKKIESLINKININFCEIISSSKDKIQNNLVKQNINQILLDTDEIFNILYQDKTNEKEYIFFLDELNLKVKNEINILKKYYESKNLSNINSDIKFENKYFFENLSSKTLKKINMIVDYYKDFLDIQISKGYNNRKALTISQGKGVRKIIKILNKEFLNSGVLTFVSNYMKKDYYVTGCAIEMSVPNSNWWKNIINDSSPDLWYTHVDQSFVTPKSIVYLSDVNETNGPTSFFPGVLEDMNINFLQNLIGRCVGKIGNKKVSKLFNYYKDASEKKFNSKRLISHFNKLPDNLKFEAHIGWYIKKNSYFEKYMKNKEVKFVGKKGSYVVFDGAQIFHRGGLIEKDIRMVLQITFGEKVSFVKKIYNKIIRYVL